MMLSSFGGGNLLAMLEDSVWGGHDRAIGSGGAHATEGQTSHLDPTEKENAGPNVRLLVQR